VALSSLPVAPFVEPMLAELSRDLPRGDGWLYEPKWDGFRALVFWDGGDLLIQSRDLKPLGRYFPELEAGLKQTLPQACVLDGEVVIVDKSAGGGLDFEALQQRIHPAESRIQLLARETPAEFVAFDLLALGDDELASRPLSERRAALERLLANAAPPMHLTPATTDPAQAADWFQRFEGASLVNAACSR
jgi:ATP-dependent DNA ligase